MACALKMNTPNPAPILLVEDNQANILVMTMFLRELGYPCDVATNGVDALVKFDKGLYALIIMDLNMPKMCGLETARRIRAIEKEQGRLPVPIIATTGNASDHDESLCLNEGMNAYLSKPFRLAELETKMQALIA